ncbi:carboxylesterase B, putative [Bodo saltans]|uniref:Carboxylic ester hydrolase n=1 Tax=Bodo saltans TaxID=75058 RepID=A0A0S4IQH1_BODSA|nr:carboxylesterase B, putative [Bodo saltans]|eukprot:CUF26482.1 carboxylesterase B, putative [Bodo saltans]
MDSTCADQDDDILEVPFMDSPSSLSRDLIESPASATPSAERLATTRNIPYRSDATTHSDHKQQLDVHVPSSDVGGVMRPVYFHVHGGGWKRGDRQIPFYGAPSLAHFAANELGFVAVTPSYRLGKYPDFMFDVVAALVWTFENIHQFGGDPSKIILSGHSAGAHIVSLILLCGVEQFDLPQYLLDNCICSVVLLSGVYSLEAPMYHKPLYPRNAIFRAAYVKKTFGTVASVVDSASPSVAVLSCGASILRPESTKTSESSCWISRMSCKNTPVKNGPPFPLASGADALFATREFPNSLFNVAFLILNASCDLGLEVDGAVFAELLRSVKTETTKMNVTYETVASTNHASICWSTATHDRIAQFLKPFTLF